MEGLGRSCGSLDWGVLFHQEVILSEAVLQAERRISQRKDLAGANVRLRETEDFLSSGRVTNARRAGGNPAQAREVAHRRGTFCRECPGSETLRSGSRTRDGGTPGASPARRIAA